MSKRPSPSLTSELAIPALVLAVCIAVWALTGAGYFWPMWPALGLSILIGAVVATSAKAIGAVIWAAEVAIWAMSGGGYFWPVWTLLGFGLIAAVIAVAGLPRRRSLEGRVEELTRTRRGALDVQATELRRIERDLHDGAQARLVALSMQLGRAEERLSSGASGDDIAALVKQARTEATAAIAELRDLARGIAPPVLTDRGLVAAVQSLADRTGANVTVNADIPHRPPPAVETAAYFVVAEALTNTAKHAAGAAVRVTMWAEHDELGIVVADDGLGGADPLGGGLTGLRQRVEALDGWLEVSSPTGEGTTIRAVLPCAW